MENSKQHANSIALVGLPYDETGERMHLLKLEQLIKECVEGPKVYDLHDFLPQDLDKIGHVNFSLAEHGHSLLTFPSPVDIPESEIWVIAYALAIAAFQSLELKERKRLCFKFQVHHSNEKVNTALYESADLLITESLLANLKGEEYGLDPGKMVYVPHFASSTLPKREPVSHLRIGMCSRFEDRKNVEVALQAIQNLKEKGKDFEFVLIGTLPQQRTPYDRLLENALNHFEQASWFRWYKKPLSHQEVLELFASFSFAVHPSGAEAGSNTIVEFLSLGIPTIVPNCSTFPYMFSGGVQFVEVESKPCGSVFPFYRPKLKSLEREIENLLDHSEEREKLSQKAIHVARERFTKQKALEKVRFLLSHPMKEACEEMYKEDLKIYGL